MSFLRRSRYYDYIVKLNRILSWSKRTSVGTSSSILIDATDILISIVHVIWIYNKNNDYLFCFAMSKYWGKFFIINIIFNSSNENATKLEHCLYFQEISHLNHRRLISFMFQCQTLLYDSLFIDIVCKLNVTVPKINQLKLGVCVFE